MPTVMPTDLRISNKLLSDDVQWLLNSTETFRCADLGTSICVLAAAASVDNEREIVEWCSLLQSARQDFPTTTTSAFNDQLQQFQQFLQQAVVVGATIDVTVRNLVAHLLAKLGKAPRGSSPLSANVSQREDSFAEERRKGDEATAATKRKNIRLNESLRYAPEGSI